MTASIEPRLNDLLPSDWAAQLDMSEITPRLRKLDVFLDGEAQSGRVVYPPRPDVFAALRETPYADVRAVILGQDPYHGAGEAEGLAFSVPDGVKIPSSLRNIRTELNADLEIQLPESGSLERWARNGILLLNTVLTVAEGTPLTHAKQDWEPVTDAIIRSVGDRQDTVVFMLWGKAAQSKRRLIGQGHLVVERSHPSGLSAWRKFRGTKPFSEANDGLARMKRPPIDWRLAGPEEASGRLRNSSPTSS